MSPRKVVLVENQALSPSVRWLRLRCADDAGLAYKAGQWVNLRLPGDPPADRRAYSIANQPGSGLVEVAVTHVQGGALSPRLCDLQPGAEALMDGPHGFFTRDDPEAPALFVATGSGLAPIRAMLQSALTRGPPGVPLTLLFGCRSRADILWQDELAAFQRAHPEFALHVTLSRPEVGWAGRSGYVQTHLAALAAERPVAHVYACGLSAMVREVRAALKPLGLGRGAVHTERFD